MNRVYRSSASRLQRGRPIILVQAEDMFIAGSSRPLSELEDLELRRDRLRELVMLKLVSPTLGQQIRKALGELDRQIKGMKTQPVRRAA
jgi:hypothetical protein